MAAEFSQISSIQDILGQMRDIQQESRKSTGLSVADKARSGGPSFAEHLKESVSEVNHMQKNADKMSMELAAGKSENIHETMLAVSQAELAFNLMVQVRNRALEAYQEVMRMNV
jgi:flagellar hook-basal body complex protein FliE